MKRLFFQDDAKLLVGISNEINTNAADAAKVETVDESLIKYMAYTARADLCPMQAVTGGIVAQEVMKVLCCFFFFF